MSKDRVQREKRGAEKMNWLKKLFGKKVITEYRMPILKVICPIHKTQSITFISIRFDENDAYGTVVCNACIEDQELKAKIKEEIHDCCL